MMYLYEHLDLLMYLRYHPRWYKILYYDPSYFNAFLTEAKTNLNIRAYDKLEGLKENVIIGKKIPAGTGVKKYSNANFVLEKENTMEER